jgi:hypothetical protein
MLATDIVSKIGPSCNIEPCQNIKKSTVIIQIF